MTPQFHPLLITLVWFHPGPAHKDSVEQADSSALLSVGVEEQQQLQRDSVSPNSADSPMSLSSPQQHSSASSLSGSDIVSVNSLHCPSQVFFYDYMVVLFLNRNLLSNSISLVIINSFLICSTLTDETISH